MSKKIIVIYDLRWAVVMLGISLGLSGCLTQPKNVTPDKIHQDIVVQGKGAPNCGHGDIVKITTRDSKPHYFQVCKLTPDFIEDCPSNGWGAPDKPERIYIKDIVAIERRGRDAMPCFPAMDFGGFSPRM